ncbi:MAG: hypothetical protein CVU66_01995 [Deltaproteobacteria bacterium HGW-Deltaproteobacteria-23]|nr:MAG: hypothetical protein CVU66_01995 [Deltaproteobacteria bacterium HGW-Deltaproteobacteria-23]
MNKEKVSIGLIVMFLLGGHSAWGAGPESGRTLRKPPQAAFDACKGKSAGDSVSITTPRGDTITAVCRQLDGQLVAMPDKMPAPPSGTSSRDSSGTPPNGGNETVQ